MSMPSDMTSDITDAVEKIAPGPARKATETLKDKRFNLTREQSGIAIAAVIAFVGVVFAGPALARALEKQRRLEARIARRTRDMRYRVRVAAKRTQKRLGKLGDRTFRR